MITDKTFTCPNCGTLAFNMKDMLNCTGARPVKCENCSAEVVQIKFVSILFESFAASSIAPFLFHFPTELKALHLSVYLAILVSMIVLLIEVRYIVYKVEAKFLTIKINTSNRIYEQLVLTLIARVIGMGSVAILFLSLMGIL